jgi:hypothetical protein
MAMHKIWPHSKLAMEKNPSVSYFIDRIVSVLAFIPHLVPKYECLFSQIMHTVTLPWGDSCNTPSVSKYKMF